MKILGDNIMEKKVVLNFNEFINEKLNNIAMDETIQGYIQQIKDGLSNQQPSKNTRPPLSI